jgi:hypothetical protein
MGHVFINSLHGVLTEAAARTIEHKLQQQHLQLLPQG